MPSSASVEPRKLLDACKAEADAKPRLYRLTMTRVTTVAHTEEIDDEIEPIVKLEHLTQRLVVEAVSVATLRNLQMSPVSLLTHGMVLDNWVEMTWPMVNTTGGDLMVIVHSIEPYVPKRGREE